jgi:hypothetical protein
MISVFETTRKMMAESLQPETESKTVNNSGSN